jgi:hypothetical protein
MPVTLKAALSRAVDQSERSMNDLVVEALASHYGVGFTSSNRRPARRPIANKQEVIVRMPTALKERIRRDAFESRTNMTHTIVQILCSSRSVRLKTTSPTRTSPFGGGQGVA